MSTENAEKMDLEKAIDEAACEIADKYVLMNGVPRGRYMDLRFILRKHLLPAVQPEPEQWHKGNYKGKWDWTAWNREDQTSSTCCHVYVGSRKFLAQEAGGIHEITDFGELLWHNPNAWPIPASALAKIDELLSEPEQVREKGVGETGKQGETCPDCGREKARNAQDAMNGKCPKWWAIYDESADDDCGRIRQSREAAQQPDPREDPTITNLRKEIDEEGQPAPQTVQDDGKYPHFYQSFNGDKFCVRSVADKPEVWSDGRWRGCSFDNEFQIINDRYEGVLAFARIDVAQLPYDAVQVFTLGRASHPQPDPQTKGEPYTAETWPKGAWVRHEGWPSMSVQPVAVADWGIGYFNGSTYMSASFKELAESFQLTFNNGLTWSACKRESGGVA